MEKEHDMGEKQTQQDYIKVISNMIQNVKYGSIIISIQDGKVVQIEKSEKIRLKN